MVSSGLVQLDVQELVVSVGDKEETVFQEAVTTNRSSKCHELKDISMGHHFPAKPYLIQTLGRGHSLENCFVILNPDPSVCWPHGIQPKVNILEPQCSPLSAGHGKVATSGLL